MNDRATSSWWGLRRRSANETSGSSRRCPRRSSSRRAPLAAARNWSSTASSIPEPDASPSTRLLPVTSAPIRPAKTTAPASTCPKSSLSSASARLPTPANDARVSSHSPSAFLLINVTHCCGTFQSGTTASITSVKTTLSARTVSTNIRANVAANGPENTATVIPTFTNRILRNANYHAFQVIVHRISAIMLANVSLIEKQKNTVALARPVTLENVVTKVMFTFHFWTV